MTATTKEQATTMRRPLTFGLATLASAAAFIVAGLGASPARGEIVHEFSFGEAGTGRGQFSTFSSGQGGGPSGIAINHTSGDVYVADESANRVQQFTAEGTFIRMWGRGVNQTTGGDICPVAPTDVCKVGATGGQAGALNRPAGLAVDNSDGPAAGSVYVQDQLNNRIQRFTSDGEFVLMWGREVNGDSGADICTAASGDTCVSGGVTGDPDTTPPTPSAPGQFSGFPQLGTLVIDNIATDGAGNVYWPDMEAVPEARVQKFDSSGAFVGMIAAEWESSNAGLGGIGNIAATASGDIWVIDEGPTNCMCPTETKKYDASDFTPDGLDADYEFQLTRNSGQSLLAIDPANQFIYSVNAPSFCSTATSGQAAVVYDSFGAVIDCTVSPFLAGPGGIALSPTHKLYALDPSASRVHVFSVPSAQPPTIGSQHATEITATKVAIKTEITPNLDYTTYHVEYGPNPCSTDSCASTEESGSIGAAAFPKAVTGVVTGLTPNTTYYYRVVATNDSGVSAGPDRRVTTFAEPIFDASCPNNLARQQTGATQLADCRAYELVSAEDQGGYDVASDLISGQEPFGGHPEASDKALYAVHNGAIPNTGKPTNRGPDPYVATRDAADRRWETSYVGIPANAPSGAPFSSSLLGADAGLTSFAFGGPEICDPCFENGSSGIPVRRPDGSLAQGMAGVFDFPFANPTGEVRKPLSADGSHLVFGSISPFEPDANNTGKDITLFDRNLETGFTQVISKNPLGQTIANGTKVAQLDISSDGERILFGNLVRTADGNKYFDLFMHVGISSETVAVADTATGVLYSGMTDDGTKVFFTTADKIADEADTAVDYFRADVTATEATITRLSTGSGDTGDTDACDPVQNAENLYWNSIAQNPTCNVTAIAAGGGIAKESGVAYFLSPELLDGASSGIPDAPNLYRAAPGEATEYVTTLESELDLGSSPVSTAVFSHRIGPLPLDAKVTEVAPNGDLLVFEKMAVLAFDPGGSNPQRIVRYNAAGQLVATIDCSTCPNGRFWPNLFSGQGVYDIVVDPSNGEIYVAEARSDGTWFVRFNANGDFLKEFKAAGRDALDLHPANHNLYAGSNQASGSPNAPQRVERFTPDGTALPFLLLGTNGTADLAFDSTARLYVAQLRGSDQPQDPTLFLYDDSGTLLRTVLSAPNSPQGRPFFLAVDRETDDLYVNLDNQLLRFDRDGAPAPAPVGPAAVPFGDISFDSLNRRLYVPELRQGSSTPSRVRVYVERFAPDQAMDSPVVIAATNDPETPHPESFQVSPSGEHAAFLSSRPLTGFDNASRYQVFRHDAASGEIDCASCNPTDTPPTTNASLAKHGNSVTEDGRVFFNTREGLVLRDSNEKLDAYQFAGGRTELISTGKSPFDSGLLSVSSDGTDAFFFTRETLAQNDHNGTLMKLYTAREGGGFFIIPPPPDCRASDECHGPGTVPAPPANLGTLRGSGGNVAKKPKPKKCKRGFVRRGGKCMKRKPAKRKRTAKKGGKRKRHPARPGASR